MQFLIRAYDGKDSGAAGRRQKARPEHIEKIKSMRKTGEFVFGGAIIDDQGQMVGSAVIYDFPDREALDRYLSEEVYVKQGVWKSFEVELFRQAKIED